MSNGTRKKVIKERIVKVVQEEVAEKEAWCDLHKHWVPEDELFRETVRFSRFDDRAMKGVKQVTVRRVCQAGLEERVEKLEHQRDLNDRRREKAQ